MFYKVVVRDLEAHETVFENEYKSKTGVTRSLNHIKREFDVEVDIDFNKTADTPFFKMLRLAPNNGAPWKLLFTVEIKDETDEEYEL